MIGSTFGSEPRRRRVLLSAGLLIAAAVLLWIARSGLVPYIMGLVVAYLMLPAVGRLQLLLDRLLHHRRVARGLAIILVYLLTAGLSALVFYLVAPAIGSQFQVLWDSRNQLVRGAMDLGERLLTWYRAFVPLEIQAQVTQAWQQVAAGLLQALQAGVVRTFNMVSSTVSFLLGLLAIPFWLFYVILDQPHGARSLFRTIPGRYRADAFNMVRIVDGILSAYVRGQLLLCLFLAVMATAGLTLLGVRFPAILGLIAGALEILPFIGPILGAVPAIIVAAVQSPLLGLWTILLFVVIQQIEGTLLVPRVSGRAVRLHPAFIMVVLVVGYHVAGFWGMLVAVPLTAIVRDLFRYLYARFQDQPCSPREALQRLHPSMR